MENISGLHIGPQFDRERYERIETERNCHPHANLNVTGQRGQRRRSLRPKIKVLLNKSKTALLRMSRHRHETASHNVEAADLNEESLKDGAQNAIRSCAGQDSDGGVNADKKPRRMSIPSSAFGKSLTRNVSSAVSGDSEDTEESQNTGGEHVMIPDVKRRSGEESIAATRSYLDTDIPGTEDTDCLLHDQEVKRFKHMLPSQEPLPLIAKGHVSRLRDLLAPKLGAFDTFPSAQIISCSEDITISGNDTEEEAREETEDCENSPSKTLGVKVQKAAEADLTPPAPGSPLYPKSVAPADDEDNTELPTQNVDAETIFDKKSSGDAPYEARGAINSETQEDELISLSQSSFRTAQEVLVDNLNSGIEEKEAINEMNEIGTNLEGSEQPDCDQRNNCIVARKSLFHRVLDKVVGYLTSDRVTNNSCEHES